MSGFTRTGVYLTGGFDFLGVVDLCVALVRMSGLWGYQSALDLYLRENGIKTLFFSGVNTDQVRKDIIYLPSFLHARR